jgi:hypothetical protein
MHVSGSYTASNHPAVRFQVVGRLHLETDLTVLHGTIGRKVKHHCVPAILTQTRALELVSPTKNLSFEKIDSEFLDHVLPGSPFASH